jgi:hypothetical protein
MRTVLVDKFDLSMFKEYPIEIVIDKPWKEEVCIDLEDGQEEGFLVNTITDEEIIVRISDMCGFELKKGQDVEVKLKENDRVFVVFKEEDKIKIYEILINN